MLATITSLLSPFTGWIIAALAILAGIVGSYFKGKSTGTQAAQQAQVQQRVDAIDARKQTDTKVDSAVPGDIDKRLDKWMRP